MDKDIQAGTIVDGDEHILWLNEPNKIKLYTLQIIGTGTLNVYTSLNGKDFSLVDAGLEADTYSGAHSVGLVAMKLANNSGEDMTYILKGGA